MVHPGRFFFLATCTVVDFYFHFPHQKNHLCPLNIYSIGKDGFFIHINFYNSIIFSDSSILHPDKLSIHRLADRQEVLLYSVSKSVTQEELTSLCDSDKINTSQYNYNIKKEGQGSCLS